MRWTLPPLVLAALVVCVVALSARPAGRPPADEPPADEPAGATEGPGWRRELQPDGTPQRNDPRFHDLLRRSVEDYLAYTRIANAPKIAVADCDLPYEEDLGRRPDVADAPFEGPANCGTIGVGGGARGAFASRASARAERPAPPVASFAGPRLSRSDDAATHGTKLYWLYVRDGADYLDGAADAAVPEGQVLVKEAWATEVVATDPRDGRTLRIEGRLHHATRVKTLFVMTRVDRETPGTDAGWVYGTLTPDGRIVTGAGRIAACMDCHAGGRRERLFGLPR